MEYECRTMSVPQLNVGPQGFIMPLCETCKVEDCTNPIEKMKISIVGVTRKIRLYNRGGEPKMVVECKGYIT